MRSSIRRMLAVTGAIAGAALSGCATQPSTLYHWGNYQPAVWSYFKGDDKGPEAQQASMEKTLQEAQAKGKALPPGFQAHLGLLYLKMGHADKAQLAFQTEEAHFPESKPYMDFLLKGFAPPAAGPAPPLAPPAEPAPGPSAGPTSTDASLSPATTAASGSAP